MSSSVTIATRFNIDTLKISFRYLFYLDVLERGSKDIIEQSLKNIYMF